MMRATPDVFAIADQDSPGCWQTAAFDFGSVQVDVISTPSGVPGYLNRMFQYFRQQLPAPTPSATCEPAHRMLIADEGTPGYQALTAALGRSPATGGTLVVTEWFPWGFVVEPGTLANYYSSKVLRLGVVAAAWKHAITLHAAALHGDGAGILLLGEAAAGKTSLTIALLDAGYRYASDDTTTLRREDLSVLPFPTPFLVREDSGRGKLLTYPGPPDIMLLDEPRWVVERWDRVAPVFSPSLLVFLDGKASGLQRVSPATAALDLLANTVFPMGCDIGRADLPADALDLHLRLAELVPAYRLGSASLADALQGLLKLAGENRA